MNRMTLWAFLPLFLLTACRPKESGPKSATPPMAIDSVTGAPIDQPNPWKNAGCDLVTDDEVRALFQIDVKRDAYNARTLPDRGFCLRSWMKPDWKERENNPNLEFKNTLVTQVLDYGSDFVSRQQFEILRRDQPHIYEEIVQGIGDGAVWSTSQTSLMVKKGHLVLKITLDHTDKPHDNLEMAKEVAKLALKKM